MTQGHTWWCERLFCWLDMSQSRLESSWDWNNSLLFSLLFSIIRIIELHLELFEENKLYAARSHDSLFWYGFSSFVSFDWTDQWSTIQILTIGWFLNFEICSYLTFSILIMGTWGHWWLARTKLKNTAFVLMLMHSFRFISFSIIGTWGHWWLARLKFKSNSFSLFLFWSWGYGDIDDWLERNWRAVCSVSFFC